MGTIVATGLDALGIVKVIVDMDIDGASSEPINVYRSTPDGAEVEVIGSPVILSGGTAILYDTTAPFDVALTYWAVRGTLVVALDTFARAATSNGWGGAILGGPWASVGSGVAADFSVSSGLARMSVTGSGAQRAQALPNTYTDVRTEVTVTAPVLALNTSYQLGPLVRWQSSTAYYRAVVQFNPNGTMDAQVHRRRPLPSGAVLVTTAPLSGLTYTAGTKVRIKVETVGNEIRVKAWTRVEPKAWSVIAYDVDYDSGRAGLISYYDFNSFNTFPITSTFDDFKVTSLVPETVTATPVTLNAAPHGWIRDPQDPARSVRLDNCGTHTFSCLNADRFVFFQGLEEEQYDSSTGVFGVIGSERPMTVAQTRKGLSSALRVVSTTLADIPALRRLFVAGRDLVLSLPAQYGWGIETYGTDSFTAGDVSVNRLNKRDMRKPQRLWGIPIVATDADQTYPTGATGSNDIPVPGATYADTIATGWTYGQLKGSTITDSFTRTIISGGWGGTTSGSPWTVQAGPPAQFLVNDTFGRMAQTDRSTDSFGTISLVEVPIAHTDIDIKARFQFGALAAGDVQRASLVFRETDANNRFELEAGFLPSPITSSPLNANTTFETDTTVASDAFTRTTSNGWGTATTGQVWTTSGGVASEYSTNGTAGLHSVASVNTSRRTLLNVSPADAEIVSTIVVPTLALGASIQVGVVGRYVDSSNYYVAEILLNTDQSVQVRLRKNVAAAFTTLVTSANVAGLTHTVGRVFRLRFQMQGSTLRARVWDNTLTEPTVWHADATDTSLTTGQIGARSVLGTGNTNTLPVSVSYDDLAVATPPANWMVSSGTIVRSTAQFHQGVASLLLTPNGVSSTSVARSEIVSIPVGATCRASQWLRCATARTVFVGINWYTSTTTFIATSSSSVALAANTWTLLDFNADAPAGAVKAQITAYMTDTPPSTDLLHVDEAALATVTGAQLRWVNTVAGTSTFTTPVNLTGLAQNVDSWYWIRVLTSGSTLWGKMWRDGLPEPVGPMVTKVDASNPTGTSAGVKGFASVFSTNPTPENLDWDDFKAFLPDSSGESTYLEWAQGVHL